MAASSKPPSKSPGTTQLYKLNHYAANSDHIYLAPAFYNSIVEIDHLEQATESQNNRVQQSNLGKIFITAANNNNNNNRKFITRQSVVIKQQNNSNNGSPESESQSLFQIKSESCDETLSSCSDLWNGDQEDSINGNHGGPQGGIKSHFDYDEEEFDEEDSNDTRSCSSSSGCSSSSNSMVGSVNRHLSLNNPQYHLRTPVSNTTASNKNGTVITSSLAQYNKDLTPKQVRVFL